MLYVLLECTQFIILGVSKMATFCHPCLEYSSAACRDYGSQCYLLLLFVLSISQNVLTCIK